MNTSENITVTFRGKTLTAIKVLVKDITTQMDIDSYHHAGWFCRATFKVGESGTSEIGVYANYGIGHIEPNEKTVINLLNTLCDAAESHDENESRVAKLKIKRLGI